MNDTGDAPRAEVEGLASSNSPAAGSQRVKVFARIRPPLTCEAGLAKAAFRVTPTTASIAAAAISNTAGRAAAFAPQTYVFQACFDGLSGEGCRSTQEGVFEHVGAPLLHDALRGVNATLLAYGQTGSGKTHTIFGDMSPPRVQAGSPGTSQEDDAAVASSSSCFSSDAGFIPRFVAHLFARGSSNADTVDGPAACRRVSVRFIELYCEKAYDLLNQGAEVKVSASGSQERSGITERLTTSADQLLRLIMFGHARRATAATLKNERSSRSHAVLQIVVSSSTSIEAGNASSLADELDRAADGVVAPPPPVGVVTSTVTIVDLAGCERAAASGGSAERFSEAIAINLSLMTLRKVIAMLNERATGAGGRTAAAEGATAAAAISGSPPPAIRESLLTRVVGDAFGGNSHTTMIVCASPLERDAADSEAALRFGAAAKRIVNRAKVNADPREVLLAAMTREMAALKAAMSQQQQEAAAAKREGGEDSPRYALLQEQVATANEDRMRLAARLEELHALHADVANQVRRETEANQQLLAELRDREVALEVQRLVNDGLHKDLHRNIDSRVKQVVSSLITAHGSAKEGGELTCSSSPTQDGDAALRIATLECELALSRAREEATARQLAAYTTTKSVSKDGMSSMTDDARSIIADLQRLVEAREDQIAKYLAIISQLTQDHVGLMVDTGGGCTLGDVTPGQNGGATSSQDSRHCRGNRTASLATYSMPYLLPDRGGSGGASAQQAAVTSHFDASQGVDGGRGGVRRVPPRSLDEERQSL